MYDKVPLMTEQDVKKAYAHRLQEGLGEGTNWRVTTAALTPGVIVNPVEGAEFQENGCGAIGRMYILGIPPREKYDGIRGIGLITTADIRETDFYKSLTEEMGFEDTISNGTFVTSLKMERHLDETADVVTTLKKLEEIVFTQ